MGVRRLPSACGSTCNHSEVCFPCTLPKGTLVPPATPPILRSVCPTQSPWSLNAGAVSLTPTPPALQSVCPTQSPWSLNAGAVSPIPASKARIVGRGELYVDARKFNPGFSPHSLFIPTPKYKSTHDTMPTYRETVFPPEVSDECESMESGYEDNSDVSEDGDSDGPSVVGAEEWMSGLTTCLDNTQKRSVRPKVRAQKDVSSDTAQYIH